MPVADLKSIIKYFLEVKKERSDRATKHRGVKGYVFP